MASRGNGDGCSVAGSCSLAKQLVFALCLFSAVGTGTVTPDTNTQSTQRQMQALVATSSSDHSLASVVVPSLGYLHQSFVGLPTSCEVLIAVKASSVNPADRSTPGPFPQTMGSDLAGVVASVEPTCKRLRVGDSVWGDIGAIVRARTDNATGKENGAYAQFAVALESQLGVMPQNIKFEEAASLPKVALTSVKALSRYGGAPYADRNVSVVILGGSGGTGSTGIQLAKAFGAKKIITTTSSSNFDFVKRLGADVVIDYHSQNWWEVLLDGSVDVIYDTVGQHGTGDRAMAKLTAGGHYVTIVGAVPEHPRTDVSSTMFINSATNLENVDLLDKLREFVETDRLRSRTLKVYPLKGILDAFAESAGGHTVGKLVIAMPAASADCSKDSLRGDIACDNSLEV